jgi:hypothetical protein
LIQHDLGQHLLLALLGQLAEQFDCFGVAAQPALRHQGLDEVESNKCSIPV